MKINSLNFYNISSTYRNNNNNSTNKSNHYSYNKTSSTYTPQEIIGRYLINFGSNEFKLTKLDKIFLDNTAQNLRLNDEETVDLKNVLTKFLQDRNKKSMDEIADENDLEVQSDLLMAIISKFDLSDIDSMIVASEISKRTVYGYSYKYNPDRYIKDYEPLHNITEKYNISNEKFVLLFDYLKDVAKNNNFNSIFDVMNSKLNENMKDDIYLIKNIGLNENIVDDIIMDILICASKQEKDRFDYRLRKINQNNFYKYTQNALIGDKIIEKFKLKDSDKNFIQKILADRVMPDLTTYNEGPKSNDEIAYIITEKYNLSKKEYIQLRDMLSKINADSLNDLDQETFEKLLDKYINIYPF